MKLAEFIGNLLDVINEFRELASQAGVTAVPHAIDRFAQDRTPRRKPVPVRLNHRVVAFIEDVRKKVRQKPPFRVFHVRDIRDHPKRRAVPHAPHDGIEPDRPEVRPIRLRADPLIAEEHHRFIPALMHQVHQFLRLRGDEAGDEVDIIQISR
ncbi:hypothetical protein D3C81_1494610 [compost metagenome]